MTNDPEKIHIGLHESEVTYQENPARGAQFYPSCTQITVTSGGSTTPGQNFDFIGGYLPSNPGIKFNLYLNPSGKFLIRKDPTPALHNFTDATATTSQEPTQSPALLSGSRAVAPAQQPLVVAVVAEPSLSGDSVVVPAILGPLSVLKAHALRLTTTTPSASKWFNQHDAASLYSTTNLQI